LVVEEALGEKIVDKGGKCLEMLGKIGGGECGLCREIAGDFHGKIEGNVFHRDFTGDNENFVENLGEKVETCGASAVSVCPTLLH
jgi:hypothetical protein